MAAKKPRTYQMSDEHRGKIQNSNILKCLIEHVEGARDMSASQVSAALGLLRKVMPDLSAAEIKQETTVRYVARVPDKAKSATQWHQQHSPEATLQ